MFSTVRDARIEIPPMIAGEEVQVWSYVLQRLHMPWYHVTIDESECEQIVFCADPKQFLGHPHLRAARVVTPGWLNGTIDWRMDLLKELWIGFEPNSRQQALVYVLQDGARIVYSFSKSPEDALQHLSLVYSSTNDR